VHASVYPVENAAFRSRAVSKRLSPSIVSGVVGILDAVAILVPGMLIYVFYVGWRVESLQLYLSSLSISTFIVLLAFYAAGLYKFQEIIQLGDQLKKAVAISAITCLSLIALTFALKISEQLSRVWAFSWFVSGTLSLCAARFGCHYLLRKWAETGSLTRNIVIVGAGEQAKRLLAHLRTSKEPWNVIVGVFDDRISRVGAEFQGLPVLGTITDLVAFARKFRTDEVFLAMPWCAENRIKAIVGELAELPVNVHLASDLISFDYPIDHYHSFASTTTLHLAIRPLDGWQKVAKYIEDKVLATLLLIAFLPLMALIALAIKLDSKGPVLFKQLRFGFNNGAISVFKFRTMYHNGDIDSDVSQARRDDPRVTRVGRFLRRTSFDELPQLFNVIQGTMSMVGPRPHAVPHNEEYSRLIRGYFSRHRVKPGITGWAQVNGLRGETKDPEKMKARVDHDVWYIENWSLLRDFYILAKTANVVWFQKTAY